MRAAAALLGLLLAAPAAGEVRLEARSATDLRRPQGRASLAVELENDGPELEALLVVEQPGLEQERRVELPVRLAAGARRRFLLSHDGRPGSEELRVQLRRGREVLAESTVRVRSTGWVKLFAGSIGPQPSWLWSKKREEVGTTEIDPAALPHDPRTWPDLDVVVWPAPRAADLDAPRAAALRRWVERGGLLLAGTAADQPHALDELGWPAAATGASPWRALGLGALARSPADLTRAAPPAESWWPRLAERQAGRAPDASPLLRFAVGLLQARGAAPEPPKRAVLAVLAGWFLLAGPVELWWQRRGVKRGRRSRHAPLRRVVTLASATAAVLLLTGSLTSREHQAVRLDVVDLALDESGARGRSLVVRRQRAGGWTTLETGDGGHAWPLRFNLPHRWSRVGVVGGLSEGPRIGRASLGPSALQRSSSTAHGPWSLVAWQVDFEPERERLDPSWKELVGAALEGRDLPAGWSAARTPAKPEGAACEPHRPEDMDPALAAACGAWSTSSERPLPQGLLAGADAAPPWPADEPALVLARLGEAGPELRVADRPLEAASYTIVRVRLPAAGAVPWR